MNINKKVVVAELEVDLRFVKRSIQDMLYNPNVESTEVKTESMQTLGWQTKILNIPIELYLVTMNFLRVDYTLLTPDLITNIERNDLHRHLRTASLSPNKSYLIICDKEESLDETSLISLKKLIESGFSIEHTTSDASTLRSISSSFVMEKLFDDVMEHLLN